MTDGGSRRPAPTARGIEELFRATVGYGKLSMQMLGAVTGASSIALLFSLFHLLSSEFVVPGLSYGDIPAALIAMGGATSLVVLAAAAAYFSQYAYHAHAAGQATEAEMLTAPAFAGRSRWRAVAQIFHTATLVLMTLSYVAFAVGGIIFIHFCLAAAPVLAQRGSAVSPM